MKTFGIILVVFGALNFLISLIGCVQAPEYADRIAQQFFTGIAFLVLGYMLITRANKKKIEKEEKDNWSNNK